MTGYARNDLVGSPVFDLYANTPAGKGKARELFERFRAGEEIRDEELEMHRADGRRIWGSLSVRPGRDAAGKVVASRSIITDITRRKQAEKRIAHLDAILLAIRNVNQVIVREKDRDRLLQSICNCLIETRGYDDAWIVLWDEEAGLVTSAQAGLGEDFISLRAQLEAGTLPECCQKALQQAEIVFVTSPLPSCAGCPLEEKHASGGRMSIRLEHGRTVYGALNVFNPMDLAADEEEQALFKEVAGDIAFALHSMDLEKHRRQLEQELIRLERLRAVGELSAGVSHNLNNILTTILGPAELLRHKIDAPELRREVDDIITSAMRARDLVRKLYLSVRTDEEESLHPVSVDQIVQQAVQTSRPRWKDESEAQGILMAWSVSLTMERTGATVPPFMVIGKHLEQERGLQVDRRSFLTEQNGGQSKKSD